MTVEAKSGPFEAIWNFVWKAPAPVVLAIAVLCTMGSVTYTKAMSGENRASVAAASERAGQAETAAKVAAATDAQTLAALQRVEEALHELTAQVATNNALLAEHMREDRAAKRAK